ncbi:ABC transporter ATP-binding protein [Anaerolentibacter hominis]|uniref:ABC transporter ATP-binding protein n=1 Tax=Anaerolentibacter hominis TaxID=3079009 RepID=UPI0031B86A46
MKQMLLSGMDICKSFSGANPQEMILNGINAEIYEGDFTVIMGPSGAGKSTLLYALSGLDRVTEGKVIYKGRELTGLNEKEMACLRIREFGFVFQQTHLVSHLTLLENVTVAGYLDKRRKAAEVSEEAKQLLLRMQVGDAVRRLPSQVSGGEAQRAAIARAVINHPGILFADEPTGALNKQSSEGVLNLLTRLNQAGQSILMVTHDLRAAIRGNRILYLEDGQILSELSLPSYAETDSVNREARLNNWLASLSW